MSKKYKAGIYLRLSKEDEYNSKESNSIQNQRFYINEFLKKEKDIELIEEYIDDGYTGTTFDRPAFLKMIEDVKNLKINTVIVKDLSRFGRNYSKASDYIELLFPLMNVRFISLIDQLDNKKDLTEVEDIVPFKNVMNK